MKVLIAGGGTGGHLFPGIAVAEELVARGHQVTFVGTARGIEARVCPSEGYPLELIDIAGLKGGGPWKILKGLLRVPRAALQSWQILRRIRPDLVVGVGGYASGPVLFMAALHGKPTAILEQNSVPGITNRILGRMVRLVFGAFSQAARFFPSKKYRLVGNPIRRRLRDRMNRSVATGAASENALLVIGGSQGAHRVNELVSDAMLLLQASGRAPRLIHQSGTTDADGLKMKYAAAGVAAEVSAFIDDMASAYRGAALAVARAGASTLAELTALGVPSLLVPFPFAADDHQTVNARELESKGAARVFVEKETSPTQLADAISGLFADEGQLRHMSAAARALGRPNAHAEIVDALEALR